jgi:hypothetical protein
VGCALSPAEVAAASLFGQRSFSPTKWETGIPENGMIFRRAEAVLADLAVAAVVALAALAAEASAAAAQVEAGKNIICLRKRYHLLLLVKGFILCRAKRFHLLKR